MIGWLVEVVGLCQGWLLVNCRCWLSYLVDYLDFDLQLTATQVSWAKSILLAKESKVGIVRTKSLRCPHFDGPDIFFVWLHIVRQRNNIVLPLGMTKVTLLIPHLSIFWPRLITDVYRCPPGDEEAFSDDFNLVLSTHSRYTIFGEGDLLSLLGSGLCGYGIY